MPNNFRIILKISGKGSQERGTLASTSLKHGGGSVTVWCCISAMKCHLESIRLPTVFFCRIPNTLPMQTRIEKKNPHTHSGTLLVMDSPPYSLNLAGIDTVWDHIDGGTNQPPFTTLKLLLLGNINTKPF